MFKSTYAIGSKLETSGLGQADFGKNWADFAVALDKKTPWEIDFAVNDHMWECIKGEVCAGSSLSYAGATDISVRLVASALPMPCTHPRHLERTINYMPHHLFSMKIEYEMRDVF